MILPDIIFIHNNRYYICYVYDIQHRRHSVFQLIAKWHDEDTKDVWFSENRTKWVCKRWCFADTYHTNLTTNVSPFHYPTTKFKRKRMLFATWLKWFIIFIFQGNSTVNDGQSFIYMKSKKILLCIIVQSYRIRFVFFNFYNY